MVAQVQWNDIDYMDRYMDFTYSEQNYSTLPQLVADIHSHKQKYIMILDPGIADTVSNDALIQGTNLGVWINQSGTDTPLEGVVWPG